ncbi:Hypp9739 [Branchiostoma lanceolatum]|uniref:Hypp9739 protein n=1 Tax=Branchiostoma lanceolatum TaxID=7740 RepID=A0A8S4MP59_BRALA|nr:Hypp9739 [Branchiostoma lanceolatum]
MAEQEGNSSRSERRRTWASEQPEAKRRRAQKQKDRRAAGLANETFKMTIYGSRDELDLFRSKLKLICEKMGEGDTKAPYRKAIFEAMELWLQSNEKEDANRVNGNPVTRSVSGFTVATPQTMNEDMFLATTDAVNGLMNQAREHGRFCKEALAFDSIVWISHAAKLTMYCPKNHAIVWDSSPHFRNKFLVNYRIAHAYFSSGMRPIQYEKFCVAAGMGQIEEKTLRSHYQAKYSIEAAAMADESRSKALKEEIEKTKEAEGEEYYGISIMSDARHCWRKNARFSDIAVLGDRTHKAIRVITVCKDDHGSAQGHEKVGTLEFYEWADAQNLEIAVHAHDNNASVNKIVKDRQLQGKRTENGNDTWHATKAIGRQMKVITSGARRSEGGDHSDCAPISRCRQDEAYTPSRTIITDPIAEKLLTDFIHKTVVYKNPDNYIYAKDTHYCESFNNAVLMYLDKRVCYQKDSYIMRMNLGILDWNEHVDRGATSYWEVEDAEAPRRQQPKANLVQKQYQFRKELWNRFMQSELADSRGLSAKLRRAELTAKAAALEERAKLQEREFKIKKEEMELARQREMLEVKMELAQEDAKLQALDEFEGIESPAVPRTRNVKPEIVEPRRTPNDSRNLNPEARDFHPTLHDRNGQKSPTPEEFLQGLVSQQAEVTKLMIDHNNQASLPTRTIRAFDGNPLQYTRFTRAFKHAIESKTTDAEERLGYLEQYTTGEARRLECGNAMEEKDNLQELNHYSNLKLLVTKLPFKLRERWRRRSHEIIKERPVSFSDFATFVQKEEDVVSNEVFGDLNNREKSQGSSSKQKYGPRRGSSLAVARATDNAEAESPGDCLYCAKTNHCLSDCMVLGAKPMDERLRYIKGQGLCFGCLKATSHLARDCRQRAECKRCQRSHPTVLHRDAETVPKKTAAVGRVLRTKCSWEGVPPIIPVKVRSKTTNITVETYAFLDSGSDVVFCTESLKDQLKTSGRKTKLTLNTINDTKAVQSEVLDDLEVINLTGENVIPIATAYTQERIPASKDNIISTEDLKAWPHLKEVNVPKIDADIGLLIGNNVPKAGGPYAIRTVLGWND